MPNRCVNTDPSQAAFVRSLRAGYAHRCAADFQIEYHADMDKITDQWTCRDWDDLPYIWGPDWSPEFWGQEMNANLEPR